jgi:hypothetical protein
MDIDVVCGSNADGCMALFVIIASKLSYSSNPHLSVHDQLGLYHARGTLTCYNFIFVRILTNIQPYSAHGKICINANILHSL